MSDPALQFRNAIQVWLKRTGIPPSRLGAAALGDPSFVLRLMRGRIPRLGTADRLLAFIGEEPVGPVFRAEVEAFIGIVRAKPYLLGLAATGDPSFVARLRRGVSPRLDTVARVRAWMAEHCSPAARDAIRAAVAAATAGAAPSGADRNHSTPTTTVNNNKGDASMNGQPMQYLGTREAAAFLGLSPRTLDRYRVTGEGPAFHKFGARIRYAQADLDDWASARRMTSTSDDRLSRVPGRIRRVS